MKSEPFASFPIILSCPEAWSWRFLRPLGPSFEDICPDLSTFSLIHQHFLSAKFVIFVLFWKVSLKIEANMSLILPLLASYPCKKSRIRETPTLSTDADIRTDTNLKRLHDLSLNNNCLLEGVYWLTSKKPTSKD